jgi:hypothetical protein
MNIYLLTPGKRKGKQPKYDYYDSAVVVASSEEDALSIHPGFDNKTGMNPRDNFGEWPKPGHVFAEVLGIADRRQQRGVVCASFNAG